MPMLLLLALIAGSPPAPCVPQFAPLDTGTYSGGSMIGAWRKDEAGAWRGQGWLGWRHDSETLEPVRLVIRDLQREPGDDFDQVSVQPMPEMDYAVRCVPQLRAGPVRNARVVNEYLTRDQPLKIELGERRYEVRLESTRDDLFDARVVLSEGRRMQVLYSAGGFSDEPHYVIEWAGDLDRDGRLDLVATLSRKYSLHPHTLLLSSWASGSALVGKVAVFTSSD
jgi:hypothetical protein